MDRNTLSDRPIKPRRLKGTYSYRFRNYVALAVITTGSLIAAAWLALPFMQTVNRNIERDIFTPTIEEKERKYLMNLSARKLTAGQLDEILEEHEKKKLQ